jgi:beta-glucanase (GH16 family)
MKTLAIFVFFCLMSFAALSQQTDGYQLVWQDEFEKDGAPDSSNWNYEQGFARNFEAQWYQPENAWCREGHLIIEARREKKPNPLFESIDSESWRRSRDTVRFSSSCLITRGKHAWKFGRFEMRAKIPVDMGSWPAFWTLGISRNWPANGEIDIMEYYRGMLLANAAWESETKYKPLWDDLKLDIGSFKNDSWKDEFHVWRMDWDEENIRLFVDDHLLNEIDLDSTYNRTSPEFNPFHQPHYLLVNLAIGGSQGGDPTYTRFPIYYIIDYIRVYQKKE